MIDAVVRDRVEIREAWRQPAPARRTGHVAARTRVGDALRSVFERSEDANKEQILELVSAAGPFRRVLDIGCYNGAFTRALADAAGAEEVHGVELLPEHAERARERGVVVTEADASGDLPFADASFDLVHANQMIEHLRATDRFLRECRRLVAPGGRVVISTNNLAAWHNVGALVLGWQPFPNHVSDEVHVGNPADPRRGLLHADPGQTHLRVFTARSLSELAAHHGLDLVHMGTNGYYPLPPRFARPLSRIDGRHAAFLVGVYGPRA